MNKVKIATWSDLPERQPVGSLVEGVDLVMVRWDEHISVLYGRCQHRGALMADGSIQGQDLICGLHGWDYRFETGISAYNNEERLEKFNAWIEGDSVYVDADEIKTWSQFHPQPYDREAYQGSYADSHGTIEEPYTDYIHDLATYGLSQTGHHGPVAAMGVPGPELPRWESIQFATAQLARLPQLDDVPVGTELVIGPQAKQPLKLEMPLFVSDMSFGALSEEAKVALAKGAEQAETGICSGEGGMLPEEQGNNSRYFYELASARFGFSLEKLMQVQAFHFKCGQGAKTGTGRYFECTAQSVLMSGYLGSIGFGFPGAIGAWAAVGDQRPIVSVSGDGGFGQYMGEFTTAVKYGMNITHILLNNSELGKISKEQRAGEWDVGKTSLHNPNFATFAEICGGKGVRVNQKSELDPALVDALTYDGPALVEVIADVNLI